MNNSLNIGLYFSKQVHSHLLFSPLWTENINRLYTHFYRPQTKFAKVMFSHLSVILSTGGSVSRESLHLGGGDLHPGGSALNGSACREHVSRGSASRGSASRGATGMHSCSRLRGLKRLHYNSLLRNLRCEWTLRF